MQQEYTEKLLSRIMRHLPVVWAVPAMAGDFHGHWSAQAGGQKDNITDGDELPATMSRFIKRRNELSSTSGRSAPRMSAPRMLTALSAA